MTSEHPNLAAALAAFQAEMPTVAKTKRANVGQYSYAYADLADVTEAATPILTKHGMSFAGSARHVEGGHYEVVGILSHSSGEQREGALPIPSGNPQQIGSAITYMRRYLYGVMTGIVTDNDDDGALASAQQQQKRERRQAAAARPASERRPGDLDLVTPAQLKKIGAAMRELGITDRDNALAYVSDVIGRPVESRNELTKVEAGKVIESLERDQRPADRVNEPERVS